MDFFSHLPATVYGLLGMMGAIAVLIFAVWYFGRDRLFGPRVAVFVASDDPDDDDVRPPDLMQRLRYAEEQGGLADDTLRS